MEWSLASDAGFAYILVILESIVIGWLIAAKHYEYIKMNDAFNELAEFIRSECEHKDGNEPPPQDAQGCTALDCDDGIYQLMDERSI